MSMNRHSIHAGLEGGPEFLYIYLSRCLHVQVCAQEMTVKGSMKYDKFASNKRWMVNEIWDRATCI